MMKRIKEQAEDAFIELGLPLFMGVVGFGLGIAVICLVFSTLYNLIHFF